jgi:acyl-coenzyme A thioesterase PaaI-like protein
VGHELFPVIFGTGVKIMFMSSDWHEVHIRLGINMWSRNYVGTIYGGSLFSAADSFYMIMLSKILGKDFVVWDKAAAIRFKRPGTERIYAKFLISEEQVADIKTQTTAKRRN